MTSSDEAPFPDTLGDVVGDWIESHCLHGPGDLIGQPVKLLPSERRFLRKAYRLDPMTGRRKVRRATRSRRKGTRKTELMAWVAIAEAVGPVRARWVEDDRGRSVPAAVPVTDPWILCTATTQGQGERTVYGAIKEIIKVSPELDAILDAGEEVTYVRNGPGKIEASATNAKALDGFKPTFQCIEEPHLWMGERLWDCYRVLTRNLDKRPQAEPWSMEATTAYQPGENSVAEAHHEYGLAVAAGEIEDESIVYDHVQASDAWDLRDDEQLKAALREAADDALWYDEDALVRAFRDPDSSQEEGQRYWLNQSVAAKNQFCTREQWSSRSGGKGGWLRPNDAISLGFDGSRYSDATALIAVRVHDGLSQALAVWEKPDGAGIDWQVDENDVDLAVDDAMATYRVLLFQADPPYWVKNVAAWHRKYGDVVREFWTTRPAQMGPAIESASEALRTEGAFLHAPVDPDGRNETGEPDPQEQFARHMRNARLIKDRGHKRLAKPAPDRKIDASVAWVIAWDGRMRLFKSGEDIEEPVEEQASFFGGRRGGNSAAEPSARPRSRSAPAARGPRGRGGAVHL